MILPGGIIGGALPSVVLTDTAQLNTGGATKTFTAMDLGAEGRRHIVIALGVLGSGAPTGCTVAGVTATQLAIENIFNFRSALYIASVPTGLTGDVVVTLASTGGAFIGVYALYNLRSATPVDTVTDAVNGGAGLYTTDLDANVSARGVVVATMTNGGVATPPTLVGLTDLTAILTGASKVYSAQYTATAAESPRTMGFTINNDTAACIATFR